MNRRPSVLGNNSGQTLVGVLFATALIASIAGTVGVLTLGQRAINQNITNAGQCNDVARNVISILKSHDNTLDSRSWLPGPNAAATPGARVPGSAPHIRQDPFTFNLPSPAPSLIVDRTEWLKDTQNLYEVVSSTDSSIRKLNSRKFDVHLSQNLRGLATWAGNIYTNKQPAICTGAGVELTRQDFEALAPRLGEISLPAWVKAVRLKVEVIGAGKICGSVADARIGSADSFRVEIGLDAGTIKGSAGLAASARQISCTESLVTRFPTDNEPAVILPKLAAPGVTLIEQRVTQANRCSNVEAANATGGACGPAGPRSCRGVDCTLAANEHNECCFRPLYIGPQYGKCCADAYGAVRGNGECPPWKARVSPVTTEPGLLFACGTTASGAVKYCGDFLMPGSTVPSEVITTRRDDTHPLGRSPATFTFKSNTGGSIVLDVQPSPGVSAIPVYIQPIDVGGNISQGSLSFPIPMSNSVCNSSALAATVCNDEFVKNPDGTFLMNGCQPDVMPSPGTDGPPANLAPDNWEPYICKGTIVRGCDLTICAATPTGQKYADTCGTVRCDGCGGTPPVVCPAPAVLAQVCPPAALPDSAGTPNACPGTNNTCGPPSAVCAGKPYLDVCGNVNAACVGSKPQGLASDPAVCDPSVAAGICSPATALPGLPDHFLGDCDVVCPGTKSCVGPSPTAPAGCSPDGYNDSAGSFMATMQLGANGEPNPAHLNPDKTYIQDVEYIDSVTYGGEGNAWYPSGWGINPIGSGPSPDMPTDPDGAIASIRGAAQRGINAAWKNMPDFTNGVYNGPDWTGAAAGCCSGKAYYTPKYGPGNPGSRAGDALNGGPPVATSCQDLYDQAMDGGSWASTPTGVQGSTWWARFCANWSGRVGFNVTCGVRPAADSCPAWCPYNPGSGTSTRYFYGPSDRLSNGCGGCCSTNPSAAAPRVNFKYYAGGAINIGGQGVGYYDGMKSYGACGSATAPSPTPSGGPTGTPTAIPSPVSGCDCPASIMSGAYKNTLRCNTPIFSPNCPGVLCDRGTDPGTCQPSNEVPWGMAILDWCGKQCGVGSMTGGATSGGSTGTPGVCSCPPSNAFACNVAIPSPCPGVSCGVGTNCPPLPPGATCSASFQCSTAWQCPGIPSTSPCGPYSADDKYACEYNGGNDCFECKYKSTCVPSKAPYDEQDQYYRGTYY